MKNRISKLLYDLGSYFVALEYSLLEEVIPAMMYFLYQRGIFNWLTKRYYKDFHHLIDRKWRDVRKRYPGLTWAKDKEKLHSLYLGILCEEVFEKGNE